MSELQAYCVKCRTKRDIVNPQPVYTSRGTPATKGTCPVCGTPLFRPGRTEAHAALARLRVEEVKAQFLSGDGVPPWMPQSL